jgi:hypothetical protein
MKTFGEYLKDKPKLEQHFEKLRLMWCAGYLHPDAFRLVKAAHAEAMAAVKPTQPLPQVPEPPSRKSRKPSVSTLIARAERKGKTVTSVTAPDGTTLHFGEPPPTEAANPWLADSSKVTKQ